MSRPNVGFFLISNEALRRVLNAGTIITAGVYAALHNRARGGIVKTGHNALSKALRIDQKTLRVHLRIIEKLGLVETNSTCGMSSTFSVFDPWAPRRQGNGPINGQGNGQVIGGGYEPALRGNESASSIPPVDPSTLSRDLDKDTTSTTAADGEVVVGDEEKTEKKPSPAPEGEGDPEQEETAPALAPADAKLVALLQGYGIRRVMAERLARLTGAREQVDNLEWLRKAGKKIRSTAGWLYKAITEGWELATGFLDATARARATEKRDARNLKARQERAREDRTEQTRTRQEAARDAAMDRKYRRLPERARDAILTRATAILREQHTWIAVAGLATGMDSSWTRAVVYRLLEYGDPEPGAAGLKGDV